ncbi:hypothetical protein ACF1AL_14635 [Streptomyces sp. NPDC014801]|uniref:hypothetical protein n=1 Tax=Streptomyces sp. NPDC014801 TaxID=3364916 RepID=UPI0036FF624B
MQNMSRTELVSLLDDIRERVAVGDSLEGNFQYLLADHTAQHPYDVAATYRVGNRMGQGGCVLVGVEPQSIRCTRCSDEDGPFTEDGLCEPCARPMPLDGVA